MFTGIRLLRFWSVGWLLAVLVTELKAQSTDVAFTRYTTEQGLSNDVVSAIAKDSRGFMWIGTLNGLNRFDGILFKHYKRTGRLTDLPGNYIVTDGITPDRNGYLWVSTNRGLYRFDPAREQGQTIALPQLRDQQADNDFISPVRFDQDGMGWFSSVDRLYRINPQTLQFTAFPLPYIMSTSYATPKPDRRGNLWLFIPGAVYQFNSATRQYTYMIGKDQLHPGGLTDAIGLFESRDGDIFVQTGRQGLLQYDRVTRQFLAYSHKPILVTEMAEGKGEGGKPIFWLGGLTHLTRYEPDNNKYTDFVRIADDPTSYPGGIAGVLFSDSLTGALWIGTTRGLAVIDPLAVKFGRQLVRNTAGEGQENDVLVVHQDQRNDSIYWGITHKASLFCWDRRRATLHFISQPAAMADNVAYGLVQDQTGRLWVGWENGASIYDPTRGHWQIIQNVDLTSKGSNERFSIRTLYRDHRGRIWLGSGRKGLFWYDLVTNRLRSWPLKAADGKPLGISRMEEDGRGRLWVLTTQGLFRISLDRAHVVRVPIQATGRIVQPSDQLQSTFHIDRQSNLWISGIDFLVKADTNGRISQTYTLANGLMADHIFGIAEDVRGHLWLTTDEQLHELDPATGHSQYYSKSSGLFANSFFHPITQNRQGELFIGAEGGFNYFKPELLRQNKVPPPVVLTEIRVNNHPRALEPAQSIQLVPGETTVAIAFAALNYSQATKNQYAYRLLGFDDEWITTDARTATYTNLAPGTYQLRIRAANNDGVWNQTGTTLLIQVIPAYYQTVWFKLLVLATSLTVVWGIYRNRQIQQQRLTRIRDRIAKDLHDDIGSTLSSIRIFSDVVQAQIADVRPESVPLLQRISANATTLAESMQDIIWTIKARHDGLDDVVSRMREFGLRLTEAKGIRFTMTVAEPFPALKLDVEQRRNLYLIFKESVNNAIKYADCTQLDVTLSVAGRQLHMLIQDDGKGFDPTIVRSGNGLANLQTRAQDIRGRLDITSAPGAGTSINVTAIIS